MGHASPAPGEPGDERPRSLLHLQVEAWVLAVVMVLAFAGGFVFRGLGDEAPASTQTPPLQSDFPSDLPTIAPPLDAEQLEGELPSGHPPVDEAGAPVEETPTSTRAGRPAPPTTAPTTTTPPATTPAANEG